MTDEYENQPPASEWKFISQLKSPFHTKITWRRLSKNNREASLKGGVSLEFGFPDASGKLDTAYDDFRKFLAAGEIGTDGGYRIITDRISTSCFEEFELIAEETHCIVAANDTEGIRRGLVYLEDRITSTGGPFLRTGKIRRTPFIKTRVSRCFFGPIKRPPLNRDELIDDVDYYPDEYLNRLVHEGINGLWLSIEFKDYPSRFFPQHGRDAEIRLEKLKSTVKQCARYGIKIFMYCNEPIGFGESSYMLPLSELEANPWFKGFETNGTTYFCTSSEEGKQYIEECTRFVFSNVPGLGGMICITNGEHPTNCYSYHTHFFNNGCPRCSTRKPWEVYRDMLAAFARGMKEAAPDAEFISWLYSPVLADDQFSTKEQKYEVYRQIAAHTPKNVTMQMNFESNGQVQQLGREFTAFDYWLAWPGPSDIFRECALNAIQQGQARVSAKIQVGCSHENASIPFMPVPGSLYRKYQAMKDIGVDTVMQCWYFGNYPGLMNKAAGELSFLPFPEDEREFLESLARIDWSGHHKDVSRAWAFFMKGYSNFPIALSFTWYGALHCSIVWPLHLIPVDRPIAPSWCFGYPDSGDRIGECIGFLHTLQEVIALLSRMDEDWQKGVAILTSIEKDYAENVARQLDIGLCKAIGLQIKSSLNVFTFYNLRERMPFLEQAEQFVILENMREIVRGEIGNCMMMRDLCLKDPRLGFHSEAEGYKFFPAKLDWRAGLLEVLLESDFPKVSEEIKKGNTLFPEYTGLKPTGKMYDCKRSKSDAEAGMFYNGIGSWKAWRETKNIYFEVSFPQIIDDKEVVSLAIEPRRLWPAIYFFASLSGNKYYNNTTRGGVPPVWDAAARTEGTGWVALFTIPFEAIPWHDGHKPLRVNIFRHTLERNNSSSWVEHHPLKPRLMFEDHNSDDMGWLCFPDEE